MERIEISGELWEKLTKLKTPDCKTFEKVIWKLLKGGIKQDEKV